MIEVTAQELEMIVNKRMEELDLNQEESEELMRQVYSLSNHG